MCGHSTARGERVYIEGLAPIFSDAGKPLYWVELETDLGTRLARNTSAHRLHHKPSKRDTRASEAELLRSVQKYRLNSDPEEFARTPYYRIDTTRLSPADTAQHIKTHFRL
jgi:hypothetical protein